MKPLGWVLAALALIVAGKFWLAQHDAEERERYALRQRDSVVNALADSALAFDDRRREQRRREDSLLAKLTAFVGIDSVRADSLRREGYARALELRSVMPEVWRPLLDSLVANHAAERAAQDSQIVALKRTVLVLTTQRDAADSAAAALRRVALDAIAQRDAWRDQGKNRKWLSCVVGPVAGLNGLSLGVGCGVSVL